MRFLWINFYEPVVDAQHRDLLIAMQKIFPQDYVERMWKKRRAKADPEQGAYFDPSDENTKAKGKWPNAQPRIECQRDGGKVWCYTMAQAEPTKVASLDAARR